MLKSMDLVKRPKGKWERILIFERVRRPRVSGIICDCVLVCVFGRMWSAMAGIDFGGAGVGVSSSMISRAKFG